MKKLLKVSFSKIYMISLILISLLILGGYFSYAMFTVSKEKSNAINIVTGNLIYDLTVDGEDIESLVVPAGTTKIFTVTLSNPNNRIARFNFYYLGSLPEGVSTGYTLLEGNMQTPKETGVNLEKKGTSGSSNIYTILVVNDTNSEVTIDLGVSVGLDYNNLSLPTNGHLFEELKELPVGYIVKTIPGENGDIYNDGEDTFIIGNDPNNYIWYSGKLWRAVSVNNEDGTTKLVTEWNISAIPYNYEDNTAFSGSHMEDWLNDTTVDGFLGNLRNPEAFIKMDSKWNATMTTSTTKPPSITIIEDPVGILSIYEYNICGGKDSYLNNGLYSWTLTPYDSKDVWNIHIDGSNQHSIPNFANGIRPAINLKSSKTIIEGNGTKDNPYRLEGDNDKNLNGVKLNTRYSGEYIRFGIGENNLYQIVSHETEGLTKITSTEPLKNSGNFKTSYFGSTPIFSSTNTIGSFLNGEYLTNYLSEENRNMISNNSIWYLGTVDSDNSYKLAKYTNTSMTDTVPTTTNIKIGLLRIGELMSGQFAKATISDNSPSAITGNTITYWTLTKTDSTRIRYVDAGGNSTAEELQHEWGVKPTLNLKENVIITSGEGTKDNPFILGNGISIKYASHVSGTGWLNYETDDNISGTVGKEIAMEAIKITMNDAKGLSGDVEYKVHVQDDGWQNYVKNNEVAGTTGQNKGIEAIQIRLTGELSEKYDIYYNVHITGIGWQGYKKNDEIAGTTGQNKKIEAIKVKLVEKNIQKIYR